MWSIARVDLGLSEDEYLAIDLRGLMLLNDRARRLRWQQEASLAYVTCAIYRAGFMQLKEQPKPADFIFTQLPGEARRPQLQQQSRELVASIFRSLAVRRKAEDAGRDTNKRRRVRGR